MLLTCLQVLRVTVLICWLCPSWGTAVGTSGLHRQSSAEGPWRPALVLFSRCTNR